MDEEAAAATAVAFGLLTTNQVNYRSVPRGPPAENEIWIVARYLTGERFVISIEPNDARPSREVLQRTGLLSLASPGNSDNALRAQKPN